MSTDGHRRIRAIRSASEMTPEEQFRPIMDWLLDNCESTGEFIRVAAMVAEYGLINYNKAWNESRRDFKKTLNNKTRKLLHDLESAIANDVKKDVVFNIFMDLKKAVVNV